jgi:uncharacterized protein
MARSPRRISIPALMVLAFLFCASSALRAERVEDLKPTDYINDFAGVLSPQTIAELDRVCSTVYRRGNAQIVAVTLKNLGGDDIDDFAARLEEKWKIGRKGSDRGVLILIAVEDHKYRIEVGYGLEGILPDAKAGDIGRQMVPTLKQGDYNTAVRIAVIGVAKVIAADAGIDLSQQPRPGPGMQQQSRQVHLSPLQTLIGGIVLLVVLFLLARSGLLWFLLGMFLGGGFGGRGGGYGGGGFGGGDGGGFGGGEGGSSGGGGASGSW